MITWRLPYQQHVEVRRLSIAIRRSSWARGVMIYPVGYPRATKFVCPKIFPDA